MSLTLLLQLFFLTTYLEFGSPVYPSWHLQYPRWSLETQTEKGGHLTRLQTSVQVLVPKTASAQVSEGRQSVSEAQPVTGSQTPVNLFLEWPGLHWHTGLSPTTLQKGKKIIQFRESENLKETWIGKNTISTKFIYRFISIYNLYPG